MHLSGFDRFVWTATFLGHILLLTVLFVRRRAGSFPAFTLYVVERIATTVVLYLVLNHLSTGDYRYAYRSLGIVDEIVQLFVFYELAVQVFRPTGTWARDVRTTFIGLIGASTVAALILTWLAHPASHSSIQSVILRSNFFTSALMSELFVGMMVLSSTVGLPWKTHVAKIAQGLGAYSMVCVAKDIVLNELSLTQHVHLDALLSHVRILTYLMCEVFWIVMLWQDAPAPRELPESMRMQIYSLQTQIEHDLIRIRAWGKN